MVARPDVDDVVVRKNSGNSSAVYVLHTVPGADQYALHSRKDAVAQTLTFAKHQHVRAWLTDGDHDFTSLEDFRVDVTA
jgi:hypothetical protein